MGAATQRAIEVQTVAFRAEQLDDFRAQDGLVVGVHGLPEELVGEVGDVAGVGAHRRLVVVAEQAGSSSRFGCASRSQRETLITRPRLLNVGEPVLPLSATVPIGETDVDVGEADVEPLLLASRPTSSPQQPNSL
jgi:hypothetical protein